MKVLRAIVLIAAVAGSTIMLTGCASTNDPNNVSSIPWDRPQSWEGSGQLGGFAGPNGIGR
jgi:hypothetical protein